jgi:transposase
MAMVAEVVDAVVGIDTHRDIHQVELGAPSGRPLAAVQIPNTDAGFAALLAWLSEHAPGLNIVVGIEGTRSYGIGVARALAAAGLTVVEVDPAKHERRGKGKSDPIDAHHAVLAVLGMDTAKLPTPRADGNREALRILLIAREEMATTHTAQTNRLRALLLAGNDTDRELARGTLTLTRLTALARRRLPGGASRAQAIRHAEVRRLTLSLRTLAADLAGNRKNLAELVTELAPGLTERRGIGPVSAAQALVSFSHVGRCRSEAAFAKLAGACPIPASSGQTVRHRLNRGGDRQLNRALHNIARTRMRCCERTRTYVARRRAEGRTDREIRRCLKRYIAREFYRALTTA